MKPCLMQSSRKKDLAAMKIDDRDVKKMKEVKFIERAGICVKLILVSGIT